jgi:hypothetical protein
MSDIIKLLPITALAACVVVVLGWALNKIWQPDNRHGREEQP